MITLILPLPAFALTYGEGVQDGGATVRGTYAMNYVMQTQPSANHLNSIYVYKDAANVMELGWAWWGPNWVYGSYSYPAWFVHINDGSSSSYEEYYSYGKVINGTFYPGQNPLPGQATPGTNYSFKVENGGYGSKTWYAKVNGYTKYTRTFGNLSYGYSIIGSERASLNDSNYAHFWSCQDLISSPNQNSWTDWVAPWQGQNDWLSYDPVYYWSMSSATNHYIKN